MPEPYRISLPIRCVREPLRKAPDINCAVVDATAEAYREGPPLFRQPAIKTVFNQLSYDLGAFGHVLAQITFTRLLYPLHVASTLEAWDRAIKDGTKSVCPELIMKVGADGPVTVSALPHENRMEMEYWYSGALVTLLLNLADGNNFTGAFHFFEVPLEFATVGFHHLIPAALDSAYVLNWQRGEGGSGEYATKPPKAVLEEMTRVANTPSTVCGNTLSAIELDNAGLSLMPRGEWVE